MKRTLSILLAVLMLLALCACGAKDEAPAEVEAAPVEAAPAAAAAAPEVTWESYLNWLADTFGADSPDPEAYRGLLFQAQSWADVDVTVGPWDKLFAEDGFNASTWDEYVAAGGVGSYNADFADDALTGSGEPTGEMPEEPAA